ncbi:hypothetical protein OEZ86_007309 [Tetradesmus obliquus]|nr:hypothetical protein OEZ86_007309 [Tetradesmus obliquus]
MKVFLDIDIGDAAKYQQESAAYQRAVDFMQQCGSQYGLSGNLADLDEEGLQMLREGYSNDPNWKSKDWRVQLCCLPPALQCNLGVLSSCYRIRQLCNARAWHSHWHSQLQS